uniref:Uncharacterized protein n=1 Tax=Cyclopterus lumpus TaxID=8103 RepID=A0A8C3AJA7_CYCLU
MDHLLAALVILFLSCPNFTSFSVGSPVYGVQNNLAGTGPMDLSPAGTNTHIGEAVTLTAPWRGAEAHRGEHTCSRAPQHQDDVVVHSVRPSSDDASGRDFKFVLIEKDNVAARKEAERLVMTKDTGKQFMSAAPAHASGNTTSYQVLLLSATQKVATKDKATYAGTGYGPTFPLQL